MAWFKKKPDPISDRERVLSNEIASLEARIKALDNQLQTTAAQPRLRSTAVPKAAAERTAHAVAPAPAPKPLPAEVFEELDASLLEPGHGPSTAPEVYNELGVRKYDLPALLRRVRAHFKGPSATNPKLVNYLAAGGIQGLRPLRYEKRVARNRFIALVIFLFLLLLGIITVFVRTH